jgi:hypothetical protein
VKPTMSANNTVTGRRSSSPRIGDIDLSGSTSRVCLRGRPFPAGRSTCVPH